MEKSSEGGNIFSKKYPTEAYDKEFCDNVSMPSTVFQPPPREGSNYDMTVKWNYSDNCIQCPTDIHVNALQQTQGDPMIPKYLDKNCLSFLHDNVTDTKTETLVPPCGNCIPGKELCVKSDVTNACRNSQDDSLNSGLFYGIFTKENNFNFSLNEQMKFNYTGKEQLVEEKRFAVIQDSAVPETYGEASKEQSKNSNNYFQLFGTPETIFKQNYNKTQPTFDKGLVYVEQAVPDFSTSESPNCAIVSNAPQNDSFEQICMLNTAVSYMCENEIQKIFIKTGATEEITQDIHSILSPATINVSNMTPRQGNDLGDNANMNPCYKVNELKLDASHYFPEDMAKLIYEINSKLGTVPPSSTLSHVSQICETAKEYCEKYSHSVPVSRNAFKNLMTVFLQVAYSWVASFESMKDISLFHPDLKNQLMKWKNSSEALLDVLIFAINNWNYLTDNNSNQLGTSDCNQMVTFKTLIYPSLSCTLSEKTSPPNFRDCQYISESVSECFFNGLCNNTADNEDKTSKRNNSCITNNNESNSCVDTFHHGNSEGENIIKRPTDITESENISHSSEFLEVQPFLDKKQKNYDTRIPRPFIYHFKNQKSSNDGKSFMSYNNTKTNSEERNVDEGMGTTDNVNMQHAQNRSTFLRKKFSKSDFSTKHPGILPITCLEKTNTTPNFDCKVYKDTENTFEHYPENHYSGGGQKVKNSSSQQPINSGRMASGGKKQMKRPYSKIGGKRTKNFEHSQNCDSDTSETYEYLRPGSYKVPMKHSVEMHNKSYSSQRVFHSSFKLDSAGGANNKKVLSEIKTCFSKNVNGSINMPLKMDSEVQQNEIPHHKSVSRGDNVMEKAKSLMPSYAKHASNGKRPTVYWNKNEHQVPRCHSYYNASQRGRFCHKRTENRNRNTSVSSLNSRTMNTFEEQMPVTENSQSYSIMKKCKLENDAFTGT